MNTPNDQIWAYLDGQLSKEQIQVFERQLEKDEDLRQLLAEAKALDTHLENREPDQPSMRFVANLMDKLPERYKSISVSPLLSSRALRWMGGMLATLLLVNLGLAFTADATSTQALPYVERLKDLSSSIPSRWLLMSAAVSIGYLGYLLLDNVLARLILKNKRPNL
jgi:anti-sigma factor RsiW